MEKTDFAAFGVVPLHRNLADAQSGALREKKQLDIEGESIDASGFQNWAARVHTKRFETTLRVPNRQASGDAHEHVETAASLLTSPRLTNANQRPVKCARAECNINIAICDRFDHFGDLLKWRGEIGIEK